MSVYAVSDIHGEYDAFMKLLDLISFSDDDELWVLGDVVDRGQRSLDCLRWVMNHTDNVHFLLGNHEDMMLSAILSNPQYMDGEELYSGVGIWMYNGGSSTILQMEDLLISEREKILEFLKKTPLYADVNVDGTRFIMSHSGYNLRKITNSGDIFAHQKRMDFLWSRDSWYMDRQDPPAMSIFGHTPTATIWQEARTYNVPDPEKIKGSPYKITIWGNRAGIDCGYTFGGTLGCLRLNDMAEFYVLSNEYSSGEELI